MRSVLILLITAAGCATSSISRDVSEVATLASISNLDSIVARDVDPIVAADVRSILSSALDADSAVRVAVLNNRELRATLREMGIVRGEILQAGLMPNPVAEIEFLPERDTRVALRVEYEITGVLMAARRRRALTPELERARHLTASGVISLGYRVRAAFYRTQASMERLALAQRTLDAFAAGRDASRAMYESGGARALDLATQEAAYERARIQVAELELELERDRERLARLLGVFGDEAELDLETELPRVPELAPMRDGLETAALEANLELLATKHRIESLSRRAGIERLAGAFPTLVIDVHGLVGNPREDPDNRDVRVSAGVEIGLPVFDRNQGTVASLVAELEATLERYYGLAVDVRSAARDARNHLVSAHRRAKHFQDVIVPAQRRVTEETMLQYNAMQIGIFHLLAAHRDELEVRFSQVETRREFWTAVAAMEALLAGVRIRNGGD